LADKKYVISETGEFPPQYKVLGLDDDGVYRPVFGPDPDLSESERKCAEMNGDRARNDDGHYIADDPSTTDVNEAYAGGKTPKKAKKVSAKKKATAKKKVRAKWKRKLLRKLSKKKVRAKKKAPAKKKSTAKKRVAKKAVSKKRTAKKSSKKATKKIARKR
jgi:hypothetical protein